MAFQKILFLIVNVNLHPSFGGAFLRFSCKGEVIIGFHPQMDGQT
jgi:hypothetical protein